MRPQTSTHLTPRLLLLWKWLRPTHHALAHCSDTPDCRPSAIMLRRIVRGLPELHYSQLRVSSRSVVANRARQQRESNRARQQRKSQGVCAIKTKPFISQDKKEIVGLPSLFDVEQLAELTDEDEFLGPMKRAILDNDVRSFSKQEVYISQFWPIASVVDNCILIDNKLAIPFKLRSAILPVSTDLTRGSKL